MNSRDKTVTEDVVEKHLLRWVKVLRGIAIKIRFMRGWPDRVTFLPGGRVVFFELKRPHGGKFEPLQLRKHMQLRRLGFTVIVAKNKEEIDMFFNEWTS